MKYLELLKADSSSDWVAPAIELEVRAYDDKFGTHGPFRGKSRPELDEAWGEMMKKYINRLQFLYSFEI